MWACIFMLTMSLGIILISCEVFTNGIEWLGSKLNVGDGVVGSVFSAVGTCLPETMVPVIAILFSNKSANSVDVGIGAIIGAPFMLSTLAFFITGASVLVFWKRRKSGFKMYVKHDIMTRDIGFFIIAYTISIAAAYIEGPLLKNAVAVFLFAFYACYVIITVRQDSKSHNKLDSLYIVKILNTKPTMAVIAFQIILALGGIILGAHMFVGSLEKTSEIIGVSALVMSLIITPIATELPEKFNSIIWISKRKDTLALGNITGAMVFQSCIPVSIGILATPWNLDIKAIASAAISVLSALATYFQIKIKGRLSPFPLLTGGLFYVAFIVFLTMRGLE